LGRADPADVLPPSIPGRKALHKQYLDVCAEPVGGRLQVGARSATGHPRRIARRIDTDVLVVAAVRLTAAVDAAERGDRVVLVEANANSSRWRSKTRAAARELPRKR
jgi:hypothetical protein